MKDQNCAYCMEGELVAAFGIKICELETSKVYLFKEQSHPGRVIVAHKKHVSEIVELTPEERAAYMEDIAKVAQAMHELFHPDKVNYGAYGDTGHHLHFHLVPKYKDQYEMGRRIWRMNPGEKKADCEEYEKMDKALSGKARRRSVTKIDVDCNLKCCRKLLAQGQFELILAEAF